jgi:capsular polysaccharide biosynthesis protein
MYLNSTFARNMTKVDGDRIPMVKDDLRRTAMKRLAKTNQTGSERRRRVVIYSREDSKFRNIKNTGALVDLFDDNRFEVTVHTRLPASFWEQVAFFADIDLLIAAIGGWAPNVLWLPPDACLVEIHLFRLGTVGFTWLVWRDFSVPVIS